VPALSVPPLPIKVEVLPLVRSRKRKEGPWMVLSMKM
jgi:hypothetical protein